MHYYQVFGSLCHQEQQPAKLNGPENLRYRRSECSG